MNKILPVALIAALSWGGTVSAQTPLKDVPEVRDGIIAVGMAFELSEKCSTLSARTWRGYLFLQSLRSRAAALGYSNAEIDAYIDDDTEKRRLEGIARARLAELGVISDDEATYCAVGRAQIAANTRVGSLLR